MRWRGTSVPASVLCLCLTASALIAGSTSIRSTSRNFLVIGPDGGQAIGIARWADDVNAKLEKVTRIRTDFKNRDFIIRVFAGPETSVPRVGFNERFAGGKFIQELLIESPPRADWEEVLEVFCGLVLSGQAAAERVVITGGSRQSMDRFPAWLVVGLSHYIDPVLKARDRRILLNWHKSGTVPRFSEILKQFSLPSGRSVEKAGCTMAVSWLLSMPDAADRWRSMYERLRSGETISCDWMVRQVPGCASAEDLERMWTRRIEDEHLVISDPGLLLPDALELVKAQLVVRPGEYGVPADTNLPPVIELKALAGLKRMAWMPAFCRAKSLAISVSAVGGSVEVRDVAGAYCQFLEVVAGQGSDGKIFSALGTASGKLEELEKLMLQREAFLDGIETRMADTNSVPRGTRNESLEELDRSGIQKYIDGVERRLDEPQERGAGAPGAGGTNTK